VDGTEDLVLNPYLIPFLNLADPHLQGPVCLSWCRLLTVGTPGKIIINTKNYTKFHNVLGTSIPMKVSVVFTVTVFQVKKCSLLSQLVGGPSVAMTKPA
jgi:hypothetical protein